MKKIILLILLIVGGFQGFSQTPGISYQAVILNPNTKELPGANAQTSILANSEVVVQFTIIDEFNSQEYQEYHETRTDAYGMINLLIGDGTVTGSSSFNDIVWNGFSKKLKVEIDFSGSGNNFTSLSEQELTFMPQPATFETLQLISDNEASIIAEQIRAEAAETTLQSNIDAAELVSATALAAEVIRATNAETANAAAIALETTNRTNNDALKEDLVNKSTDVSIDGTSDTKYPSVKSVKTYVDDVATIGATALAAEIIRATNAEIVNATAISLEATTARAAELVLTNDLVTEAVTARAAESGIQSELDATQTGAGLNADGTYTANGSANYIATSTSIVDATEDLDTQVKTNADAILLKAALASPTFTGTPTLPTGTIATTQTAGNSSTAIATTAFVDAATTGVFVDMTTNQTVAGVKTFSSNIIVGAVTYPNIDGVADQYLKTDGSGNLTWISPTLDFISDADLDTKIQLEKNADEDQIRFDVGGSEAAIIDNNGNFGIGTSTPSEKLDISGEDSDIDLTTYGSDISSIHFEKAKGTSASPTILGSSSRLGFIEFKAYDGSQFGDSAAIYGYTDGTQGSGSTPGSLWFATTPGGTDSYVDRMEIDSDGDVTVFNDLYVEDDLKVTDYISTGIDGTDGELRIYSEQGVTDYLYTIRPNPLATQDVILTLPADDGTASQVLQTNGSGVLAWTTPSTTATAYSGVLPLANGGTGSATKNFVDLTTNQTIAGTKTFSSNIVARGAIFGAGGNGVASNTAIGTNVLVTNSSGINNVAIGTQAGFSITGSNNVAIGTATNRNAAEGDSNIAIGNGANYQGTSGANNIALGTLSYRQGNSGSNNIVLGRAALYQETTGSNNIALGNESSRNNNGGEGNITLGYRAGNTITTGDYNLVVGYDADIASGTLTNATAIGTGAIVSASNSIQLGNISVTDVITSGKLTTGAITLPNTDGTASQVLQTNGSGVLTWTTPSTTATAYSGILPLANGGTGSATKNFVDLTTNQTIAGTKTFSSNASFNGTNIGVGNASGSSNTAVGGSALNGASTGHRNTAVGQSSMLNYVGTSFDNNTSVGYNNLVGLTTGSGNTSVGAESMMALQTGTSNTSIGNQSLINSTGNNNIGVGQRSGDVLTTGSNNTMVGTRANVLANNQTNATALGYEAVVTASNTIQLGNGSVTDVITSGKLTIGAITLPNTDGTASQVLQTNGSGVLAWSTPSSAAPVREVADEFLATISQTSFTLTQTPSTNSKVKMYVNGIRISNTAYSVSGTTVTYIPSGNGGYALSVSDRIQFDFYY